MKKWRYHVLFVAVCLGVFLVLRAAPPVKTPRLPADAAHEHRKDYPRCPSCHGPDSSAPMPGTGSHTHLSPDGSLRGNYQKCYFCHKPSE